VAPLFGVNYPVRSVILIVAEHEAGFLDLSSLMGASSSAGSDLGWNIMLSLGNGVELRLSQNG